jgi:hypothetical protein
MGNTLSLVEVTRLFASGMPRRVRESQVPLGATHPGSDLLCSHLMGSVSSLVQTTRLFTSRMPRQVSHRSL